MSNKLFVVGIGPGDAAYMSPAAKGAIEQSQAVVGYQLYLDLVGDLLAGKTLHHKPLGEETERVQLAMEQAERGVTTALISSGDVGIYALATLVFEQMEVNPKWQALEVEVVPGISAMQMAAARVGAPLGHDFCTISLSDLLTPWEVIERRINAAAEADFVVAFYNPVSRRRDWQLAKAKELLLRQRPGSTPVILGRQLGRQEEQVSVIALADLDVSKVDMLTVVIVGNGETKRVGEWVYTPRGYQKKRS